MKLCGICTGKQLRDASKYATIITSQPVGTYSTKLGPAGIKKEENKYPYGARCGSVETCRKAIGILLPDMQGYTRKARCIQRRRVWQLSL